jgi:hypothetical protein
MGGLHNPAVAEHLEVDGACRSTLPAPSGATLLRSIIRQRSTSISFGQ